MPRKRKERRSRRARRNLTFDAKRAYPFQGPRHMGGGKEIYVFNTPDYGVYTVSFFPEFDALGDETPQGPLTRVVVYEISFSSTELSVHQQSEDNRAFMPVLSTVKAIVTDFVRGRGSLEVAAYKALGTDDRRNRIYAYMLRKAIPKKWTLEATPGGVFFYDFNAFQKAVRGLDSEDQVELATILYPFAWELDLDDPSEDPAGAYPGSPEYIEEFLEATAGLRDGPLRVAYWVSNDGQRRVRLTDLDDSISGEDYLRRRAEREAYSTGLDPDMTKGFIQIRLWGE